MLFFHIFSRGIKIYKIYFFKSQQKEPGKRTSSNVFCFFYMCAFIWSIFQNLTFVTLVTHRILTCDKFRILKTSMKSKEPETEIFLMPFEDIDKCRMKKCHFVFWSFGEFDSWDQILYADISPHLLSCQSLRANF